MIRVLAQSPERWSKIYCLSRRPPVLPGGLPPNAEHIALDFLQSPEEISAVLTEKGVTADHVFFFSYIQVEPKAGGGIWSNATEMCDVNKKLLSNFLQALSHAEIKPQRIMLQTGAKNYGLHLGQTATPQQETDPRVTLEPNFYYAQEDCLWDYCKKNDVGWNICMPSFILGAVPDAAMNVCFPLAVYAAVTKHLGGKLEYPADLAAWDSPQSQSTSMLNAYMAEWSVLTPAAKNEKFNAFDDSAFTWGRFWPKLAKLYGLEYTTPDPEGTFTKLENAYTTPPRG
jgi:nucleoside-diphosphate-sugar epimerase